MRSQSLAALLVASTTVLTGSVQGALVDPISPGSRECLAFDVGLGGETWVRGRTYKARFDRDGATYVPFLGSAAPQSWPVTISLARVESDGVAIALAPAPLPRREGERVVIDHGLVDEVYALSLDAIEQTFVVEERPRGATLSLTVAFRTDLAARETAAGIEFANEFGAVRYGRAYALDVGGSRTPIPTRLGAGGIEIELPADLLAAARFPLIIDPVVSTFALDTQPAITFQADVAVEGGSGHGLVVYAEAFSSSDGDVYTQMLDVSGTPIGAGYVDMSLEDWDGPRCASLRTPAQFLVAAAVVGAPGSIPSVIWGRTLDATTSMFGHKFDISTTAWTGDKLAVDVGGDPNIGVTNYCVVWERRSSGLNRDIQMRLVRPNGTLVGDVLMNIDQSDGPDRLPSISKSNGQVGGAAAWTVAWERNGDIRGRRIAQNGTLLGSTFTVSGGIDVDASASVSSPRLDGTSLITWLRDFGTHHDIYGALLRNSVIQAPVNLTELSTPRWILQDQIDVGVDSDGRQFALVYAQSRLSSPFDYDVFATSLHTISDVIGVTEAHVPLDVSAMRDARPAIASAWGGGGTGTRYLTAWDKTPDGVAFDVSGGIYAGLVGGPITPFCSGDGSGTACPCGNSIGTGAGCPNTAHASGSRLVGTGDASLAADTLQLICTDMPPGVICTFLQGSTSSTVGLPFGDGLRCATGTVIRLRTKQASPVGSASHPDGTDGDVHVAGSVPTTGGQRHYQVLYRNAASFCTPETFNATNGLRVIWLP